MAITAAVVTVTTTATALTGTDTDDLRGQGWYLKNSGSVTVYVGGSTVTAAGATQGTPLAAGEGFSFDSASSSDIPYVITASGTSTLNVFRTGT